MKIFKIKKKNNRNQNFEGIRKKKHSDVFSLESDDAMGL